MKLSLAVLGLLAVFLSLSEAAGQEESSSLAEGKILDNGENFVLERSERSAKKKSKQDKIKRKQKVKSGGKNRKGKSKKGGKNRKVKAKKGKKSRKGKANKGGKSRKGKGKKGGKNRKVKVGKRNNKNAGEKKVKKGTKKNNRKLKGKKNNRNVKKSKETKNENEVLPEINKRKEARGVLTGSHCEYVDLCMVDRMAADGCTSGQKFVIKSPKGTRRQFLMVDGSKIIAFLKNGKKITDCGTNMTDVTSRVSCKTIDGASDIKLVRQNVTETTTAAAEEVTTEAAAEAETTEAMTEAITDSMPPLSAGQIHCPCPERTCITTITSTNNNHEIKCGSKTFNVPCGGPLMGSKVGVLISIIDVFSQPLCSTNTYLTLIKDLVWKCSDLNIPAESECNPTIPPTGDATMAPPSMGPEPPTMDPGMMTTRSGRNLKKDLLKKRVF